MLSLSKDGVGFFSRLLGPIPQRRQQKAVDRRVNSRHLRFARSRHIQDTNAMPHQPGTQNGAGGLHIVLEIFQINVQQRPAQLAGDLRGEPAATHGCAACKQDRGIRFEHVQSRAHSVFGRIRFPQEVSLGDAAVLGATPARTPSRERNTY